MLQPGDVDTSGVQGATLQLMKAGTIQAPSRGDNVNWPSGWQESPAYGGATDLWGGTWAPADINASNFGVAIYSGIWCYFNESATAYLGSISITVYYSLAGGFNTGQDAVIYASQTVEIRYDQMVRAGSSGGVYGPVSRVIGDLARLPPSGMEGRPCQVFVKPTRGDFNTLPDAGLDGFTVQVKYRPTYIFRP